MTAFEFLCIVERNGGLVYQAMPNGRQPATDFTLTKMAPNSLTFENPSHDFPKMIRYTLTPTAHSKPSSAEPTSRSLRCSVSRSSKYFYPDQTVV